MHSKGPPEKGKLITVKAAAERLGVSARTGWSLVAAGDLPRVRVGKHSTRIDDRDVDAYIDKHKQGA